MRLIDADAFIEENQEIIDCEIAHPKYQDTLRELIDQAPTLPNPCGKPCAFERTHGEWIPTDEIGFVVRCSECNYETFGDICEEFNFCPNCGASMQANDRQVTGKLNEPKDSHSEYWNSIGEWKEGEAE